MKQCSQEWKLRVGGFFFVLFFFSGTDFILQLKHGLRLENSTGEEGSPSIPEALGSMPSIIINVLITFKG